MQAKSTFVLDVFNSEPPYSEREGVTFSRATVEKTFTGELEGHGSVQMLAASSPTDGAGYVALERISAKLHGRQGTFALLHIGTMTRQSRWAKWPIVPGSGTEELRGIRGEGAIDIAADGTHTLTLEYELD